MSSRCRHVRDCFPALPTTPHFEAAVGFSESRDAELFCSAVRSSSGISLDPSQPRYHHRAWRVTKRTFMSHIYTKMSGPFGLASFKASRLLLTLTLPL